MTRIRHKGFSLIELFICLLILGCVLLFCFPFSSLIKKNAVNAMEDRLRHVLSFSRVQAFLINAPLLLIPVDQKNFNWACGIMLIKDDGSHQYQNRKQLIREWQDTCKGLQVHWKGFQTSEYLLFSTNPMHSSVNGYFQIQQDGIERVLVVNRLGKA